MLNKETVSLELYKFSVTCSVDARITKDEKTGAIKKWEYLEFLFDDLVAENFTDDEFLVAIRTIKRTNPNMYGKMPNLAMFIEARPEKPREPIKLRIEHKERKLHIRDTMTPEQLKAYDEACDKISKKYIGYNMLSKEQKQAQSKDWDEFKRNRNIKNNTIPEGIRSPQLQKLINKTGE